MDATELEKNLEILGELLRSRGLAYELLVGGGGGLLLLGFTDRPTIDIDVIALGQEGRLAAAFELLVDLAGLSMSSAANTRATTDQTYSHRRCWITATAVELLPENICSLGLGFALPRVALLLHPQP